jgi:hypothetical protein
MDVTNGNLLGDLSNFIVTKILFLNFYGNIPWILNEIFRLLVYYLIVGYFINKSENKAKK